MSVSNPTSELMILSASPWQMPICPETYQHQDPVITDEEASLLEAYTLSSSRIMAGVLIQKTLDRLHRFEQPLLDTLRLGPEDTERFAAKVRRHLFKHMAQTRRAFWSWSKETWIEVIQGSQRSAGVRFWMITFAYLFSDFFYVGALTPSVQLADAIFGEELVDREVSKIRAPLTTLGYSHQSEEQRRFRRLYALVILANRSPYAEAISAQVLVTVANLLSLLPEGTKTKGRQDLMRLQTSLCHLGILDEPALLFPENQRSRTPTDEWQKDTTVDPTWRAWICAFYEQTPYRHEKSLRQICYCLFTAGRWLKKAHPEITEPIQWGEALASEYVTYTCQAYCGDYILPSHSSYAKFQVAPQKLSPASISHRLAAMRVFFSHLQRRSYTVQGKPYPKFRPGWSPGEAFKTPDDIEAARRSDEIRRLQVGCVRREWAPEMQDEQGHRIEPAEELCYLRIPTNKMRGEFYVPVPSYVADAIEVWESVRPPNQEALIDRKTHKPTNYLFQYRNDPMGQVFLNDSVIPLLCKLAGINQVDVVGRITSHRARATTATWMLKMGVAPIDIGKLLGHTDPLRSLPWYLREDKHRLGRAYRKANPLERYVAAILDTNAHARQEPCVFYYLADGPDGRPRMCGNPHFSRCIHQLQCVECEAFIDHEQAEAIEKRDGTIVISVPIPLQPQMIAELNEQDEEGSSGKSKLEALPPPVLPSLAFHFNKKVPLRTEPGTQEALQARLTQVEGQIAKKQGKADRRSASLQALLKERSELQERLADQKKVL